MSIDSDTTRILQRLRLYQPTAAEAVGITAAIGVIEHFRQEQATRIGHYGHYVFDGNTNKLVDTRNQTFRHLTPALYRLFEVLTAHPNACLAFSFLYTHVTNRREVDLFTMAQNIKTHIRRARVLIEDTGQPKTIRTKSGFGYGYYPPSNEGDHE